MFFLDRNLEDVNDFYNRKFADASRRVQVLSDRYSTSAEAINMLDRNEFEELMGALLDLRNQLRKLQWFGEVNRRGFLKITKKLDKKVPNTRTQQKYLAAMVDPKPFAGNIALSRDMKTVNDWLTVLGEAKAKDDAASIHSSHSMHRVSSKSMLNLPSGLLDTVDQAIQNDDLPILKETLMEANLDSDDPERQKLFLNLLQRSISCRSKQSIQYLLKEIKTLEEIDEINGRNCVHRLVISIGRAKSSQLDEEPTAIRFVENDSLHYITPASASPSRPTPSKLKESALVTMDDEHVKLLLFVLDNLEPGQQIALMSKDSFGRLPLHYAAQFGIVVICQLVMKHMQDWGQFNVEHGIDTMEWQDNEGLAPLHLAVIGGHPLTTKALLSGENWKGQNDYKTCMIRDVSKSSAVLALATKSNFTQVVRLLVEAGVDINWQDETGETALHVAARFGHDKCAKILLEGTKDQTADVELTENAFSWTPLHVASVDGHLSIVELLISAHADHNKLDASGWTAKEHAALRGHLSIADRLAEAAQKVSNLKPQSISSPRKASPTTGGSSTDAPRSQVSKTEPVKTYGHRYLTNESMILVSLGTMDMRKHVPAVMLDRIPITKAHATQLDTALSVVVTASEAQAEPTVIDLPVQDNISTEPIVFTTVDASKVRLYFDLVPTYAGNEKQRIGRGVAILSSIKPSVGVKRMSLQGDISVPILNTDLEVIGCVNFNFLIITPFSHPNMGITSKQTYWREMSSTMVIGHRGLGKNVASNKSLQLGENTLQSFIAAANLGANYVEFDVQLTKDHVPVIYHDFLVSETGIDAPVHTMTLEQFLHVNSTTPRTSRPLTPPKDSHSPQRVLRGQDRQRSQSLGGNVPDYDMTERMKHTRDFKMKGFKGNSRGNFIQAPFTTLEEMFIKLPDTVGFNIEMKYPMLHESEEHEMDTYAVELNSFVDTVLTKVYDLGKKRKVIFSSFNPDICLLLSFKQPSIPILFLTDAGASPVGDIRASSLQEAIRFASRWNLLGIVSAAEPFCNSPRLVKVVKDSGLVCVSYGTLNNDPVNVQVR
jgi:glycerophosphodiester phosphodiesterase